VSHDVPWLRSGTGATPAEGGCILQVIDWIDREGWSDQPRCVHPVLARLAVAANDGLGDHDRQRLLDLVPRLMGTASGDRVLLVRLGVFCARSALHIYEERFPNDSRPRKAIEAAERWCEEPTAANAAAAASAAAASAAPACGVGGVGGGDAASTYALAAGAAAYAADSAGVAYAASTYALAAYAVSTYALAAGAAAADAAAAASAAAASAAADSAGVAYAADYVFDLLLAILEEYDRLTDRKPPAPVDLSPVAALLAAP
jgi:pyruvate/2-oxoglutarate dehydrogenase complex dihydrolipoamide acyltransferase (E2) component